MSDIHFYTNEHISPAVAAGLRRRGVEVLTTQEAGMLGQPDTAQLAFAASQGRALVTQDDDYLRLHAQGTPHGGIVYAPRQTQVGELVRSLMLIYQVLEAEDMQNHVEFV